MLVGDGNSTIATNPKTLNEIVQGFVQTQVWEALGGVSRRIDNSIVPHVSSDEELLAARNLIVECIREATEAWLEDTSKRIRRKARKAQKSKTE